MHNRRTVENLLELYRGIFFLSFYIDKYAGLIVAISNLKLVANQRAWSVSVLDWTHVQDVLCLSSHHSWDSLQSQHNPELDKQNRWMEGFWFVLFFLLTYLSPYFLRNYHTSFQYSH